MTVSIIKAGLAELDTIADLFDQYRQFYELPTDITLARSYLKDRLEAGETQIFAASVNDTLVGFTQVYTTYCSLAAQKIFILYDLFVAPVARRTGAGEALMERVRLAATEQGISRIDLQTATDNTQAQTLYEKLGYVRETEFYTYSLEI